MNATKTAKGAWTATETTAEDRIRLRSLGWWFHPMACTRRKCSACKAKIPESTWYTFSDFNAKDLAAHTDESHAQALDSLAESIVMSRSAESTRVIPCPDGESYMPFQLAGIEYAIKHRRCIIGDEMGLGKTIMAIGYANYIGASSILCVVPARLRINWMRELEKWLTRDLKIHIAESTEPVPPWHPVVITNYDKIWRPYHLDSLVSRPWDLIIWDEAHFLKNPTALRTQAALKGTRLAIPQNLDDWFLIKDKREKPGDCEIRKLPPIADLSDHSLFLSGTPLDNDPLEIQSLAASCVPDEFENRAAFERRYKAGCYDKNGVWDYKGPSHLPELQYRLRAHCMIRRLKKDVLTELPAKVRQVVVLPTNGASQLLAEERSTWSAHCEDLYELAAQAELARASGNEETYSAHVKALSATRMEAFAAIGKVRHELARKKVPAVLEHAKEAIASVGKVLVMGHHRDVLEAIHEGIPGSVLFYGGMTMKETDDAVKTFMTEPECPAFIGSMLAAGLGLTLTATNTAIFAEQSWVPKDIRQSEDRIHRIGQDQSVLVQHLVYDGSLDATMANRLVEKMEMADLALDKQDEEQEVEMGVVSSEYVHAGKEVEAPTKVEREAYHRILPLLRSAIQSLHPVDSRIAMALCCATSEPSDAQVALGLQLATKYLQGSAEGRLAEAYFARQAQSIETAPSSPSDASEDTKILAGHPETPDASLSHEE